MKFFVHVIIFPLAVDWSSSKASVITFCISSFVNDAMFSHNGAYTVAYHRVCCNTCTHL